MRTAALLALILILTAVIRIHTFPIPFERDEGEYSYAGQLMLQGIPPYQIAYNMKLPGTYAAHALNMAVFGQTIQGVHAGLLVWNAGAIVLLFFVARRLFGHNAAALAAAASYAWLSVGPSVMGTASHATQYVVTCAMAGLLLTLRSDNSSRLWLPFWGGLCFGLSFLMKQHGILFGAFGGLYLCWVDRTRLRLLIAKLAAFGVGFVLPYGITCLLLWRAGVFTHFWFWTVTYARAYTSQISLGGGWINFSENFKAVVFDSPALFALAAVGFVIVWLNRKTGILPFFLTAFVGFSFLSMAPGLFFREHYFVLILPSIALLIGAAIAFAPERIRQPWPAAVFVLLLGVSVWEQWEFFFQSSVFEQSRYVWGANPFPEAIPIAQYIEAHTQPTTRIAVLGSEPEIYFYSHRHSATGYIYTYSLMERQPYAKKMQGEMIADLVGNKPQYVVWVNIGTSWGRGPGSWGAIFDWWSSYGPEKYEVVGIADMLEDHTEYRWDAAAAGYKIQSNDFVTVLKRRS